LDELKVFFKIGHFWKFDVGNWMLDVPTSNIEFPTSNL
jgi:hypothetical protein